MKKLTVAALTALLMSGAAAHAQNNQQHNPHGGPSGNPPPPNNHAPVNSNVHAPGGNPPPANIHGPNNSNPHPQVVHGGPVVPRMASRPCRCAAAPVRGLAQADIICRPASPFRPRTIPSRSGMAVPGRSAICSS